MYLFYFIQSKYELINKNPRGGSIPHVKPTLFWNLLVPLPPLPIQKKIVQNIKNAEEKFKSQKTQFENIKENYENSITYVNHIQSSILDAAFSGKLVK